jgi:hypothetical protein
MKAKELIKTLMELDKDQDLSVFFCNGSIYKDGLTNIGNVIAEDGKFIVITNQGKWGTN